MLRMIIELDKKKIEEEKLYDEKSIYDFVDSIFYKRQIKRMKEGTYEDTEEKLTAFLGVATMLSHQEAFARYVNRWEWYEEEGEEPEDLIKTFKIK